jgi:Ca2+-transporting ATPase
MPSRLVPADRSLDLEPDRGLTTEAVTAQRARFGANDIVVAPPSPWLRLALDTARDPMLWFLIAISALFTAIGSYGEAAVLAVALVPLIGMDLYLHRRTQASTQGLASRLAPRATVLRDGAMTSVAARDVVPGDLVEVGAGQHFPADGVLVRGTGLQVDESSLTGESYPARKTALAGRTTARIDAAHWAFAGTRLLGGNARLRVVGTGADTLYGEIVRSALQGSHARTPLQASVARLVTLILAGALVLCVALAAIRLAQGHGLVDAAVSAMTLAIAALPEEFPVVFTFFLGVGVYRLARRQALVRRAVVVENIGRTTAICTDKTGTLTAGTLRLSHRMPAAGVSADDLVAWAAATAADDNDPLDRALRDAVTVALSLERAREFAFTEQRRRATAIVRANGDWLAVTKGAPETVLGLCTELTAAERADWLSQVAAHATAGRKVIAAARATAPSGAGSAVEPGDGFALLGLMAFEDPIRDGVREAVVACRDAGIRVIMLTGDHPGTAEAIARGIGLGDPEPRVVTADALGGGSFADATSLGGVDVVARATPSQKLTLVQTLQRAGEIVAVTGDGVNDVPALQTADVGIAMGERGTQSAREIASIVLLDDNFRTIVRAIGEGRQLTRNLRLAFAYLVLIHVAFVVSAAAVPLFSNPLLYLPIHIVWLELIIHPTALLVFQDLPASRLARVERDGAPHFFAAREWWTMTLSGLVLAALLALGFEYALGPANDVEHARGFALAALVCAGAAMTAVLSRLRSRAAWISVAGSLGSLVVLVQVPWLAALVHLRPLHAADWTGVTAVAALAALSAWRVRSLLEAPSLGMRAAEPRPVVPPTRDRAA